MNLDRMGSRTVYAMAALLLLAIAVSVLSD